MSSDWLDQLNEIREDAAKQEEETRLDLSILKRGEQSINILRVVDAHNALRRVNQVLLGSKGLIDVFDKAKQYDFTMALVWQGGIANPRRPDPDDNSDFSYILVGTKGKKLFVNGRPVSSVTPEGLKAALVQAAKKPGVQKQG